MSVKALLAVIDVLSCRRLVNANVSRVAAKHPACRTMLLLVWQPRLVAARGNCSAVTLHLDASDLQMIRRAMATTRRKAVIDSGC